MACHDERLHGIDHDTIGSRSGIEPNVLGLARNSTSAQRGELHQVQSLAPDVVKKSPTDVYKGCGSRNQNLLLLSPSELWPVLPVRQEKLEAKRQRLGIVRGSAVFHSGHCQLELVTEMLEPHNELIDPSEYLERGVNNKERVEGATFTLQVVYKVLGSNFSRIRIKTSLEIL
jgi:hypothetical protein